MEMIPAALSAGGALMNLFGGSGPPAPAPVWHPPGMDAAAGNITSQIGQNLGNNVPGQLMPQYQQLISSLMNNPGTAGMLGGANTAGALGSNAAGAASQGGDFLSMLAHAIGGQAFDPQNALYGRTQQQLQEQTRASNEARGINSTPYGAGVENKAMSDFNIDWQNNLLQRMIGGGSAAGNLMNSGVNLSAMAPGLAYQAGQFPYQAFNTIGQNNVGNLDKLAQAGITAQQIPNQAISQWLSYIGAGNQGNQVSNQNAQVAGQNQQLGFMQNQIIGNQLGQAVNGFNKAGGFPALSSGINNIYNGGNSGGYTNQLPTGFTGPAQSGQIGWGS